mmetsp:Transcript_5450/g.9475  ORF Transcript_5450/g.9475 Transcript_5450/m.9475 type:complete len:134 (+) Transcript_5450:1143-1544(+)
MSIKYEGFYSLKAPKNKLILSRSVLELSLTGSPTIETACPTRIDYCFSKRHNVSCQSSPPLSSCGRCYKVLLRPFLHIVELPQQSVGSDEAILSLHGELSLFVVCCVINEVPREVIWLQQDDSLNVAGVSSCE